MAPIFQKEKTDINRRTSVLLRMLGRSKSAFLSDINYRAVRNVHELYHASKLVYHEYLQNSYLTPNPRQMKLILQQATVKSTTFIAYRGQDNKVLGTLTLVYDSPLGLPMDRAYKNELDHLRKVKKGRLGEITMFAFRRSLLEGTHSPLSHSDRLLLLLNLFKSMFIHVRQSEMSHLVACFHPKHDFLYELLRFDPLGGLKSYTGAKGSPAVSRVLDIHYQAKNAPLSLRKFFGLENLSLPPAPLPPPFRFTLEEFYAFFSNLPSK